MHFSRNSGCRLCPSWSTYSNQQKLGDIHLFCAEYTLVKVYTVCTVCPDLAMKLGFQWKIDGRDWCVLLAISVLPWAYFPLRLHFGEGVAMLVMTPLLIFAPVGWFFAEMAGTLAPSPELKPWCYGVGFSLGVFSFGYLCLANWRYHHPRRKHA